MIKYTIVKKPVTERVLKNDNKYNTILKAAGNLPYLIVLLRQQDYKVRTSPLYTLILEKIDIFINELGRAGFMEDERDKAKYLICAAIDEAFLCVTTAFIDYKESLISCFYKEELGGENFFNILEELCDNIPKNIHLIQFGYLLLCLGFEGKYALRIDGQNELTAVKEKIHAILAKYDEETKSLNQDILSSQFINSNLTEKAKFKIIALSAASLFVIYFIFSKILSYKESVIEKLITNLYF